MSAGTPRVDIQLSTEELPSALGATILQRPFVGVQSVSTDSRAIAPGTLFFALSGERVDGHDFVESVAAQGAAAVVVAHRRKEVVQKIPSTVGVFLVEEPLAALQSLAAWHRKKSSAKVIGVTGSVGKTTTKELLAAALAEDSGEESVLKTQGNLNSQIGLPLMLLMLSPKHRFASLEMGLSQFGEMHRLSMISRPNVATITAVASAHVEFLGSLEGVAKAKAEIFDGLSDDGIAVLPDWDERIVAIGEALSLRLGKERVLFVGESSRAAFTLAHLSNQKVSLLIHGRPIEAEVPLVGVHNAKNAALGIACAVAAGVSPERAARGVAQAQVPGGRSRLVKDLSGFTVLDDSYNANPASVAAALSALSLVEGGRRVAILGDMLELGPSSTKDHYEIGQLAARSLELLLAFGRDAKAYVEGARAAGLTQAHYLGDDFALALEKARSLLQRGDRILLKGSRGMKIERFLEALR